MKFRVWSILAMMCGLVAPIANHPVWVAEGAVTSHTQVVQKDRKADAIDTPNDSASTQTTTESVLVLGSSIAAGWHDELGGGGYLQRAFAAISAIGNVQYNVVSRAIPGQGVMHVINRYPDWIKSQHPDIVVLAWGALDDAHDKTPMPDFREQIRGEIQTALDNHAVVFVTTPPISKASYTQYSTQQTNLLSNEIDVAENFHNPNVHIFDVFDEMKKYLAQHNQTYVPYSADGWHPNALGHILGAQLLASDFFSEFGVQPVKFLNPRSIKQTKKVATH